MWNKILFDEFDLLNTELPMQIYPASIYHQFLGGCGHWCEYTWTQVPAVLPSADTKERATKPEQESREPVSSWGRWGASSFTCGETEQSSDQTRK